MSIEYTENTAVLIGAVSVDDAETLLQWLQAKPAPRVDLAGCTHMHAANLQVLMAARPLISAWPRHSDFASLLSSVLTPQTNPRAAE